MRTRRGQMNVPLGVCGLGDDEMNPDGAIANDGLESGLAQREKMSVNGGIVQDKLDKDKEYFGDGTRTNQEVGSVF